MRKQESLRSRLTRWRFNLFPCYWSTGAKITFISPDFHEVDIKLPLSWRTRNIVGVIFGGSMFGATDPILMTMFMKILGRDYIVWDKSGSIRYRKPGRSTLYAEFRIDPVDVETVTRELKIREKLDLTFKVDLKDAAGTVHAEVEKVIHFRKKRK